MEIILGLILLVAGGEALVRGSVAVARKFGISELMIGLTLVGFGTSTPELVTSVKAAFAGSPGIAVGNVVGSNIANVLIILGLAALIYPVACKPEAVKRDGSIVIAATLCCVALVLYGEMTRPIGLLFIGLLVAYVYMTYRQEKNVHTPSADLHRAEGEQIATPTTHIGVALAMAVGGIALTIVGANFLVGGAIELSRSLGMSETVIGLTVVAVGTSLPELVTSLMAAIRKKGDIALGNVIGSNIYNIWGILGLTAVIQPLQVPAEIAQLDIWVALATAALLFVFARSGHRVSRVEGAVFLGLYVAYVLYLIR